MTRSMLALLTLLSAFVMGAAACRSAEELRAQVTLTLVVVGVEDDELVEIVVADETRRARPADDLVTFVLALEPGDHDGAITVFGVEDEDDGVRLEPRRCGTFAVTVDDEPTATGIVADQLARCDGEEGEGEGEEGEGEGEEGEGEEGEGEGEEGEGEGEGEGPEEGGEGEGE